MYYLIYSSYAVKDFTDDDLKELLIHAREKNERLGITGMLYYFNGKFVQLIEGEKDTVVKLGKEIEKDTRHNCFLILKEEDTDDRFFTDWSMCFKSISPKHLEGVKGFNELNKPGGVTASTVIRLFNILS